MNAETRISCRMSCSEMTCRPDGDGDAIERLRANTNDGQKENQNLHQNVCPNEKWN